MLPAAFVLLTAAGAVTLGSLLFTLGLEGLVKAAGPWLERAWPNILAST